jgi:hypothetical protein
LIGNNTSHINNPSSFYDGIQNDEQAIKGIIADLRQVIDHFSTTFARAGDIILQLARRLDETKQCEQGQICKRIKEILNDELKKGKISEKWIEKCLPKEYKRSYVVYTAYGLTRILFGRIEKSWTNALDSLG